MATKSAALRLVSVRSAPVSATILPSLMKRALDAAHTLYRVHDEETPEEARRKRRLGEAAFYDAYAEAVRTDEMIRSGSIFETGPARVTGGERTKIRIKAGSREHVVRVAQHFKKILGEQSGERLARAVIAGSTLH